MKNQLVFLNAFLFSACCFVACNDNGGEGTRKTVLTDGWQIQSSAKVNNA